MPRAPKLSSFPAIRGALKFYQVASIITGVGLLLLVAEMILKYTPLHVELFAGGSGGAPAAPRGGSGAASAARTAPIVGGAIVSTYGVTAAG